MTTVANSWGHWRTGFRINEFQPGVSGALATSNRQTNSSSIYLPPSNFLPQKFQFTGQTLNWQEAQFWFNSPLGYQYFTFNPELAGSLEADSSVISGTLVSSSSLSGSLDADVSDISGTLVAEWVFSGSLEAQASVVAGTFLVEDPVIEMSGSLEAQASDVDGAMSSSSSLSGALASQSSDLNGTLESSSSFSGSLAAQSSQASGMLASSSSFAGALAAGSATVSGTFFVGSVPPPGGAGRYSSMLIAIGIRIN